VAGFGGRINRAERRYSSPDYPSKVDAKCKSHSAALGVGFSASQLLLLLSLLTCWRRETGSLSSLDSNHGSFSLASLYCSSIAPHSIYGIAPFIIFMLCTYTYGAAGPLVFHQGAGCCIVLANRLLISRRHVTSLAIADPPYI
jgi:hypothetical protein